MHLIPLVFLTPFLYGFLVGEVALRAGKRSRSTAMQVATGLAALIGAVAGKFPTGFPVMGGDVPPGALMMVWGIPLVMIVIGTAIAVSRVRYL